MKKFGEIILNIIAIICTIIMVWFVWSVFDTNAHNLTDQAFHPWNIFTLLF